MDDPLWFNSYIKLPDGISDQNKKSTSKILEIYVQIQKMLKTQTQMRIVPFFPSWAPEMRRCLPAQSWLQGDTPTIQSPAGPLVGKASGLLTVNSLRTGKWPVLVGLSIKNDDVPWIYPLKMMKVRGCSMVLRLFIS